MANRVLLVGTAGPAKNKEFVFDQYDTLVCGRASDCHIRLSDGDMTASRHHFILEVNPPAARLRDLGSRNGTFINEVKHGGRNPGETPEEGNLRQYPQIDLRDADLIRVGKNTFEVKVEVEVVCFVCGSTIARKNPKESPFISGALICDSCIKKMEVEKSLKPPDPPEPMRCQKCGKDDPNVVAQKPCEDYVCGSCVEKAQADPHALIMGFIQRAAGRPSQEGPDISDYEIGRQLGVGGFGAVYLAKQKSTGREVALKVMLSRVAATTQQKQLFQREIQIGRALKHPNVVQLFDYGSTGGAFYFTMEYCRQGNIADLIIQRLGKLPLIDAGPMMLQILSGLAYVHDQGKVHRDLKPQNILISTDRGGRIAKIGDFGLAKAFTEAGLSGMTATGDYAGSYPFMPREQITNFRDIRPVGDVWSIGATFYTMLTAKLPRVAPKGKKPDPVLEVLEGTVIPVRKIEPSMPKGIAAVIDRALAVEIKDRYQNAGQMRAALEKEL